MENEVKRRKISEMFVTGLFLCIVGGFLDAYTYVARGQVFANAQTGNIILLVLNLCSGEGVSSLRYLVPIVFFILGVMLSELFLAIEKNRNDFKGHTLLLAVEAVVLVAVGFMPSGDWDLIANATVSFAAAVQFNSFRKMDNLTYATSFCTGNLRSMTAHLFHAIHGRDKNSLIAGVKYFVNILFFALGVLIGYYVTSWLGINAAFAVSALTLLLAIYMLIANAVSKRKNKAE